jgi:MoCo/4Fe-4S cofactor protein with predicted Tat translocation signal
MGAGEGLDLAGLRARLAQLDGRAYWRSLEELAQTAAFRELLENEFSPGVVERIETGGVSRRRMLELLGASLGLAGLTACTKQPPEKIVPYVTAPEEAIPGKPLYYATAFVQGGVASGILVESHLGRPTKVEGNPEHPASLGAASHFAQASILGLYDPDRSKVVVRHGRISSWVNFLAAANNERQKLLAGRGAGFRILTETVASPSLAALLRALLAELPEARWHQYQPVSGDAAREGARLAFGEPVNTVYRLESAGVIVALDADFLACGPGAVRYAREFAARRRPESEGGMNRLYVVEPAPSATGSLADHRLPLSNRQVDSFARALAAGLGLPVEAPAGGPPADWTAAVVADLKKHAGRSVIVAGEHQPPAVHALAHAMNHALGNAGKTVTYTEPLEAQPADQRASLRELVEDLKAGRVKTLLILGGNPAYNAPADLEFREQLLKAELRIHLSLYEDETSELCHWHLPEAHSLEAWGDAKAFDGTVTILQPLIEPLYAGRSVLEVVSIFAGQPSRTGEEIVREHWRGKSGAANFERWWRTALHDGLVRGSELPPKPVSPLGNLAERLPQPPAQTGLELSIRPDPAVWDGSFANNGWLQELPKPVTKLTWDNVALVSPAAAERLALSNGAVVELALGGRSVRAPVWIVPGHADDCITVHLGYGRARGGKVSTGVGFNAYRLQTSGAPWSAAGLTIQRTGERHPLACTQDHHSMEGRRLVREATLEEFRQDPHAVHHHAHTPPPELTLYPPVAYEGYSWGMTIDLNACLGCGVCAVACQAENNIPVVGKDQVVRGREMNWIRIDRYFQGSLDNPLIYHQPVPCMHCDNAPCEIVCPTSATVHSAEGLNQMVYNRCVGTRYCSNNCPYKVRRFNFYLYSDWSTESLRMLRNPDVTVRSRGVMEKCTYCVQRINAARITAKREDRRIRDGEVVTACQAACPTQAITFGDLNDPDSRVARLKKDPRNYGILEDLNTRPRTTYLARLRNPNPDLDKT